MAEIWDVIIVGAGTAGMPAATFAARRGARVLALEAADVVGGTTHLSTGQMSAAGSRLQAARGIEDSADLHFDDVMHISKGTADAILVRLAVDHAADTLDWLMDNGFEPLPDHPVLGLGHEPYRVERYCWGADGGVSILNAIRKPFEAEVGKGTIALMAGFEVTALSLDSGAVTGVAGRGPGGTAEYRGRNIVLTTGGYASNPELFERINGYPQYADAAYPYARGHGLKLGEYAGGWLRGAGKYYCSYGSVLETGSIPSPVFARPNHWPEQRPPWEIHVNGAGERFVAEDNPSVDAREHALLQQPDLRYWIIFDQAIAESAPELFIEMPRADMFAAFESHPMFTRADTLAELATRAGIDGAGLDRTIATYNNALGGGDPLGRKHRPAPVATPPFYAVRVQGNSITGVAGLAVDERLRVIDNAGTPIPNLFAAGEVLGAGQTMGASSVGGMMVTPALTFGRLLGDRILDWAEKAAVAAE